MTGLTRRKEKKKKKQRGEKNIYYSIVKPDPDNFLLILFPVSAEGKYHPHWGDLSIS